MYSDKQRLQQIHEHAGVIRSWSEILRLQLVSTYVSRYGSETSCPVYDPVLPKWDGKENITIAHARALKEVETVDIAPIVMETVDIEGLEIVVLIINHLSQNVKKVQKGSSVMIWKKVILKGASLMRERAVLFLTMKTWRKCCWK